MQILNGVDDKLIITTYGECDLSIVIDFFYQNRGGELTNSITRFVNSVGSTILLNGIVGPSTRVLSITIYNKSETSCAIQLLKNQYPISKQLQIFGKDILRFDEIGWPNKDAASSGGTGDGTVKLVIGTGKVNGLTLTGMISTTGALTLGGDLEVSGGDFLPDSKNKVFATPSDDSGNPSFRELVATHHTLICRYIMADQRFSHLLILGITSQSTQTPIAIC